MRPERRVARAANNGYHCISIFVCNGPPNPDINGTHTTAKTNGRSTYLSLTRPLGWAADDRWGQNTNSRVHWPQSNKIRDNRTGQIWPLKAPANGEQPVR